MLTENQHLQSTLIALSDSNSAKFNMAQPEAFHYNHSNGGVQIHETTSAASIVLAGRGHRSNNPVVTYSATAVNRMLSYYVIDEVRMLVRPWFESLTRSTLELRFDRSKYYDEESDHVFAGIPAFWLVQLFDIEPDFAIKWAEDIIRADKMFEIFDADSFLIDTLIRSAVTETVGIDIVMDSDPATRYMDNGKNVDLQTTFRVSITDLLKD